jgi:putative phage-type endonuclease
MIEIFNDIEQGTKEWFEARAGIPTASMFSAVISKGRGSAPSATRKTYMLKLLGERLTGELQESFTNEHLERGKLMEAEARTLYEFQSDNEVNEIGFVRNGDVGCSPDGVIGEAGLLEIKTKLPHLQLDALLKGEMPSEHKAQVQGQLMVTEREWCDFVSYWPKLPLLLVRVERDEAYIKELAEKIEAFNKELQELEFKFKHDMAA